MNNNIYSQHKLVHCQIIHVIPIKLKLIEENHQIRLKLLFFFSFHLKEKEKPNIKRKRVHQPTLIKFINFLFKLQTYLFTTNLTQSLIPFRTRFSFTQLLELILPLTYHVSHRLTSIFFDALPPLLSTIVSRFNKPSPPLHRGHCALPALSWLATIHLSRPNPIVILPLRKDANEKGILPFLLRYLYNLFVIYIWGALATQPIQRRQ